MINENLNSILSKDSPSKEDIVFLLSLSNEEEIRELFSKAQQVRKEFCGNEIHAGLLKFQTTASRIVFTADCGFQISNYTDTG